MTPSMTIGARLRWDVIQRFVRTIDPTSVLEIGPGVGAVAARWCQQYSYAAVELDPASRDACQQAISATDVRVAATLDEIGERKFDLVAAFEVLEHIDDDIAALAQWRGHLVDGGHILLSVPAGPDRFGPTDRAVGHHRRYDRESINTVLAEAGFDSVTVRYNGVGLGHAVKWLSDRLVQRRDPATDATIEERTGRSGRFLQPQGRVHATINAMVATPFTFLQRGFERGSIGTGLVAMAQRRE